MLANSFVYVQSDVPEGVTLAQYRADIVAAARVAGPYPTNRAYALAIAGSMAIVAIPHVIAGWVRRHA